MKTITIKKGEILEHKGTLNSKVYRVEKGLLRSFSIDSSGKEHIFMFAPEGWIVADSQWNDTSTELYIDALEDATHTVSAKDLNQVSENVAPLIKRISVLQKRIIMLMSASAIERYEHFTLTYPQVIQRVPQKMIASYLGVTPEALSKVKSSRARENK